jgi:tetratricopeptide repeat protein
MALPFDAASRTRILVEIASTPEPKRIFVFVEGAAKELALGGLSLRIVGGRLVEARAGEMTGSRALVRLALAERGSFDIRADAVPRPPITQYPELAPLLHEADVNARGIDAVIASIGDLDGVLVADLDQLMAQLAELPDAASAVLRLVDGARTVAGILREAPYEELLSARILERLVAIGIVRLAAPVPASLMPEPASPPPLPARPQGPVFSHAQVVTGPSALPSEDELEGEGVDADIRSWLHDQEAPDALLSEAGFNAAFGSTPGRPARSKPPPPPPREVRDSGVFEAPRPAPVSRAPVPPPSEPPPPEPHEHDRAWLEESGIPRTRPNRAVLFIALGVLVAVVLLMGGLSRRSDDRETAPPKEAVAIAPERTNTATAGPREKAEAKVDEWISGARIAPPIAGPDAPEDVKRAEAFLDQQRYAEAGKLLEKLRATRANDPAVWVLSGQLHVDAKHSLDLARDAADRALAIDPKFYRAWVLKGSVMQFLGRPKLAEDAYNKALALEPDHPMSTELRAILEQMKKK